MDISISVPETFCKPTYGSGCKGSQAEMNRLIKYDDREYTVEECYELCVLLKDCAGFNYLLKKKHCALFRKGCSDLGWGSVTHVYFSLDDCRFGM